MFVHSPAVQTPTSPEENEIITEMPELKTLFGLNSSPLTDHPLTA